MRHELDMMMPYLLDLLSTGTDLVTVIRLIYPTAWHLPQAFINAIKPLIADGTIDAAEIESLVVEFAATTPDQMTEIVNFAFEAGAITRAEHTRLYDLIESLTPHWEFGIPED